MGVPTRSHIIDSLDWLDKTELGDEAATIARQAMQWAETGEAKPTFEQYFYDLTHDIPGRFGYADLDDLREYTRRVQVALQVMDAAFETFGVEFVEKKRGSGFSYLNTGDSYGATIVFDWEKETWGIGSWAARVEKGGYV